MVPFTRRRLLQCAVALAAGAAGCGGEDARSPTPTVPARRSEERFVPEHHAVRNPAAEPPVRFPDDGGTGDGTSSDDPPARTRTRGFVATAETAERLRFADVDGAAEAREFLSETAFDSETVYVETRGVRACYTLALCHVSWTDTSIDTAYGSVPRDADVRCEVDERDVVSMLIRIPEALDPEAITGHGSSWSSNGCRRRRPPESGESTEPPDYGPKTTDGTATDGTATDGTATDGAGAGDD